MTVIVITTGTSTVLPSDWTDTNLVEAWGAGAGGNSHVFITGGPVGGGGAAYSSGVVVGLTPGGTITIQIGVGGLGETPTRNSTAGTDTWFNGSTLALSSVGAKGGSRRSGDLATSLTGGVGGLAASGVGTTKNSGGNGGNAAAGIAGGAGGGGAATSSGAGGTGGNSTAPISNGGVGGSSVGAGGTGGTSGSVNGAAGASNQGGGSAGGGGFSGDNSTTAACNGGTAGFPGAGGSGGGSNVTTGSTASSGAGGQLVLTYTPAVLGISTNWTDAKDPQYVYNRKLRKFDYSGYVRAPLAADNSMAWASRHTDLPPVGRVNGRKWDYLGVSDSPLPAEFLVPLPVMDVPQLSRAGAWRKFDFQGLTRQPLPPSIEPPHRSGMWFENPMPSRLSQAARSMVFFAGAQIAPLSPNAPPAPQRTFLPLIGVGS